MTTNIPQSLGCECFSAAAAHIALSLWQLREIPQGLTEDLRALEDAGEIRLTPEDLARLKQKYPNPYPHESGG